MLKKILIPLRYPELWHLPHKPQTDEVHLKAAMDWLCVAQDATKDGGVSALYDLWKRQWAASYRETTGYIIETFLEYYHLTGKKEYIERATQMGDWELSVQCNDGAVGEIQKDDSVGKKIFNTGQVMLGYNALYKETGDKKYLEASQKGANWIVSTQEADGSWVRFTNKTNEPKTYQSRVAWPLLALWNITNDTKYKVSAEKAIVWILQQQQGNYWFDNTGFSDAPFTHLIAYTISGLLESYRILGAADKQLLDAWYGAADTVLEYYNQHRNKFLPATFDSEWRSQDIYSCLTGNAQLAIVWMQTYQLTGEEKFLEGAWAMLEQTKSLQCMTGRPELYGGILGSYPVDGNYSPYKLPNWAPKFFADALMMKLKLQK